MKLWDFLTPEWHYLFTKRNFHFGALLYESIDAGCSFPSNLYLEKSFDENAPYTN
ncbi:hypothetical protein T11_14420 [Trichinella zimbabwensis]|uniref:Uncharacterized protein n=1 Tax=Trichinella zimbabwensis TaxID=268475 RepID=A0A0V1GK08_9BILA|nr:hypothetical protein T11_14420 [Trichinella zimbabwensis]